MRFRYTLQICVRRSCIAYVDDECLEVIRSPHHRHYLANIVVIVVIVVIGAIAFMASPGRQSGSISGSLAKPNPTESPLTQGTFPTDLPPAATAALPPEPARPALVVPEPTEILPPEVPAPFPRPNDPYQLTIYAERETNTKLLTQKSKIITIGTVKEVLPARWTTPDGLRPANPWAFDNKYTIFTPVRVEVKQYLKGQQSQRSFVLFALGGQVGQDKVAWGTDQLNVFQPGEQVLVFLSGTTSVANESFWGVVEHYTMTKDGYFSNGHRSLVAQQLVSEIQTQMIPLVTRLARPISVMAIHVPLAHPHTMSQQSI